MLFVGCSKALLSLALSIPRASRGFQDDKEIRVTVLCPDLLHGLSLGNVFSSSPLRVSFTLVYVSVT